MGDGAGLLPRQIWAEPTTSTSETYKPGCTPFLLQRDGTCLHIYWVSYWTGLFLGAGGCRLEANVAGALQAMST